MPGTGLAQLIILSGAFKGRSWMKNTYIIDDNDDEARLLHNARFLYRRLTVALGDAIKRIEADQDAGDGVPKHHMVNIHQHYNALYQIIELEANIVKRSETAQTAFAGTELDLDAAREEISSRLSKLAAASGRGSVPEQPEP